MSAGKNWLTEGSVEAAVAVAVVVVNGGEAVVVESTEVGRAMLRRLER